jgi:beta-lactamase regulating signal transducer with metallopeptidase domain
VTAWLAETLAAVTAAMLLVLALRRPVARAFGAGWGYALWLTPAARLVLPPLGLVNVDFLHSPAGSFIPPAGGVTALPPAAAGPGQWVPFMLASWAGGAVIFLILQWLGYRAFLRRLGDDARPARPPFYRGVATFVSGIVKGPVALGLLRRMIVIPADFSRRYSPAERRLAMEHERTHHRHGDLWWNALALLVLAVNWFNPIAWLAFRAFRTDQELACDAAVAARASAGERCDYARALVKAATAPGFVAACSMSDTGDLKRRLRMIARHRSSRLRSAGGAIAVALLAFAGLAVGGKGAPAAAAAARTAPAPAAPKLAAASAAAAAPIARHVRSSDTARDEEDDVTAPPRAPAAGETGAQVAAAAAPAPASQPALAPAPPPVAAPALDAAPAPAAPPLRIIRTTQVVYRVVRLDRAHRAQVEEAIAYALARTAADSAQAPVADGAIRQAVIFRVHFRTSQGENIQ